VSTVVNPFVARSKLSSQRDSLADKLNRLFDAVHPAGRGTPYSNKEVAGAIRASGGSISDVYIWQLRTGRRDNPTRDHLAALANFFGVSPAYFFDEHAARQADADLDTRGRLRRMRPEQVSLRSVLASQGLSPESQKLIQQLVDRCLELEGRARRDSHGADPSDGADLSDGAEPSDGRGAES
jgi:transcriptional regulator with XRE-family HTH domain